MPIKMKLTANKHDFGLFPMDFVKRHQELNPELNPKADYLTSAYYENDLTLFFHMDLFSRLTSNQNVVVSWYGPPGSNKSWGGGHVVEFIKRITKKDFYICHNRTMVVQTLKELAAKGPEYVKGVTILMDEQEKKKVGVGAGRESWDLGDIMDMVREFQINFICISPEARDHPHDFLLKALREFDEDTGLAKHLVFYPGEDDPAGYIITKKPTDAFLKVYTKAKSDNIMRVLKGEGTGRAKLYRELGEKIAKTPLFIQAKSAKHRRMLVEEAYEGYSNKELDRIAFYASMSIKKRKEGELVAHQEKLAETGEADPPDNPVLEMTPENKKTLEVMYQVLKHETSYLKGASELGISKSTLHEKVKIWMKNGWIKWPQKREQKG